LDEKGDPVSDEIDLQKSTHHKATANKKQRHRQRTQTKKTKKSKTMTSLLEPSTKFKKHNSKKRVIEKASQCLRHFVSIGRKGDPVGDKIDLKNPGITNTAENTKTKTQAKNKNNTKTITNKTMTSPEEPSTQLQKHNYKKRVIEKASHCLCHLASIQ
jgi:hypothetical protein